MRHLAAVPLALATLVLATPVAGAPPAGGSPPAPRRTVVSAITARLVSVDLDGDGKVEECALRLGAGARLEIAPGAGGPSYTRPMPTASLPATTLRVHRVRAGGAIIPLVEARVALAAPRGAEEVVVLAGWPVREVFAGRTGPMGRDAEWERHVTVRDDAVTLFQRATNVTRCDGAPTFIHPQVYDFKAGRFVPRAPTALPPAGGPRIVAQRQAPAGAPTGAPLAKFHVSGASSIVGDAGRAESLTPPGALTDGDPRTAWIEGATQGGRGQFATVRGTPGPFRVKAVRIVPGHGHSQAAFAHYNRLQRAQLIFGRGAAVSVELPRELAGPAAFGVAYWITLPEPVATSCVTLLIDSTWPGQAAATPAGGRTAVAELTVFTEADFGVGLERLVADLAAGAGGDAATRLVVAQGARAEAPLLAALERATGTGRTLLVEALAEVATPSSAPALGRALAGAEREHRAAARALRRLGATAVPALAAILADRSAAPRLRALAARQLGLARGEAVARALLDSLAGAPDDVRRAVGDALRSSAGGAALALAAADLPRAADARHRADLLRAVAIAAGPAAPDARARAAAAVVDAAPRARSFEERFRLARAAGALRDARLAPALEGLLGAAEPEIREAAAASAAELPPAAAGPLLARALKDAAPEVRRAAVAAVGRRRDVPLETQVAAALVGDRWPLVRREAAAALAERCAGEVTGAALRHAVADADREVARTALRGLVACRDPRAGKVLLGVLRDGKRPALLRETAAGALGTLADRGLVPELGRLLDELRTEPGTDDQGESLVVTLARALGRIGDERALAPLRQASVDPASARIRAGALEAIGAICPVGAAKVFAEAEADRDQRVVRAARAARSRCRR